MWCFEKAHATLCLKHQAARGHSVMMPTFGIWLQNRGERLSLVSRVHGDAPFPLCLGLHYPTNSTTWLVEALQSRVARRNLVGFDSMVPRPTALWPLVASRSLLLRLVYIGELWLGPACHLLAMIGLFIFRVHLIGWWWRGNWGGWVAAICCVCLSVRLQTDSWKEKERETRKSVRVCLAHFY